MLLQVLSLALLSLITPSCYQPAFAQQAERPMSSSLSPLQMPPPPPLYEVKQAIIDYYTSGNLFLEQNMIIDGVIKNVDFSKPSNNSVWVFDVDETSLNNWECMLKEDFTYVPTMWDKWLASSKAPAFDATLRFYNHLKEHKYKVIFLTGRQPNQFNSTYTNLVNQGFTDFEKLITRSELQENSTHLEFKSKVRQYLTEIQEYKIEGTISDQSHDLQGKYTGLTVKFPNYIYWEE